MNNISRAYLNINLDDKMVSIHFRMRESGKPRSYKFACLFVKEFGRNYIKYGEEALESLCLSIESSSP